MMHVYHQRRSSLSNRKGEAEKWCGKNRQSLDSEILTFLSWLGKKVLVVLVLASVTPQVPQGPGQGKDRYSSYGIHLSAVEAAISCVDDSFCEKQLHPKSSCTEQGTCSNPYARGCLVNKLKETQDLRDRNSIIPLNIRVCNSNDPPAAAADGLCREPQFNYTEVRIHNGNWESSMFLSWIMQILLSERLGVPVTIGIYGRIGESFYNYDTAYEYSTSTYPFESLEEANRHPGGDCRLTSNTCSHVMPEVWNGQEDLWRRYVDAGSIDPVEGSGQVGKISLYIPYRTAELDLRLDSHFGLRGEENRQKLASTFKRPTTWIDYCEMVSPMNCSVADDVATRYPAPDEEALYHHSTDYIGHFRSTEQNNCTANPTTCTGHVVAPPCDWSSFIEAQMYWHKIALESNGPNAPNSGYSYGSMIQIWKAANATQSHVMMWFWKPEPTIEEFRGGLGEFQQVLLPEATAKCNRARPTTEQRCSADFKQRIGLGPNSANAEDGACDSEAHSLRKVLSASLGSFNEGVSQAEKNPAYETIRNIRVSDLEINEMFQRWDSVGVEKYGFDAREAVCSWVVENIDTLDSFIPPGFPRLLDEAGLYHHKWYLSATMAFAGTIFLALLGTCVVVHIRRKTKVFVYAQVPFILLILFGLSLVEIAAVIYPVEPSKFACVSREWFILLGYTSELVPLLVKVSAISCVLQSSKKMKRVRISPEGMYVKVASVLSITVVYLILWTTIDPPTDVENRLLSGRGVEEDQQRVDISLSCKSVGLQFWWGIPLGFQAMLLVGATVLAFQSRTVAQEFNESRTLGMMVYSHFVFLILRTIAMYLEKKDFFKPNVIACVISIILSLDVLSALCIYILPKCSEAQNNKADFTRTSIVMSSHEVSIIQASAHEARTEWLRASQRNISYNTSSSRVHSNSTDSL